MFLRTLPADVPRRIRGEKKPSFPVCGGKKGGLLSPGGYHDRQDAFQEFAYALNIRRMSRPYLRK